MKYATGGNLRAAIPALRAQPNECVRLIAKVARAIAYAHGQGILHRDLQPGNILLDGNGEPLVSDFGLAKWLDGSSDLTRTLTTFGTPGYIHPSKLKTQPAILFPRPTFTVSAQFCLTSSPVVRRSWLRMSFPSFIRPPRLRRPVCVRSHPRSTATWKRSLLARSSAIRRRATKPLESLRKISNAGSRGDRFSPGQFTRPHTSGAGRQTQSGPVRYRGRVPGANRGRHMAAGSTVCSHARITAAGKEHRGAAIREPEREQRTFLLRRWDPGRHPDEPRADSRFESHQPHERDGLSKSRRAQCSCDRPRSGRGKCSRRNRPPRGRPRPRQRAVDRRPQRPAPLGRALRPHRRRCDRPAR